MHEKLCSGELLWQIMQWRHCIEGPFGDSTIVYKLYLNASQLLFILLSLKGTHIQEDKECCFSEQTSTLCLLYTMGSYFEGTESPTGIEMMWCMMVELPI